MSAPAVTAASNALPASAQQVRTFDQALEQRQRAQAGEGAIPNGLWQLGDTALRISDRMQFNLPQLSATPASTASFNPPLGNAATVQAKADSAGDDMFTRAKYLIDTSFGYAVLTQQLVRGANQAASGLTTLMRSS